MADKMLIDATHPEETRVVVLRGNRVEEFDFESANRKQLRGNIYLAKVTRVEPSLQAAFVDYGGNRHGFLAFSEIHPDYYQIPVADRQALIAQEERDQRAADAEADNRAGTARPKSASQRGPPSRPRCRAERAARGRGTRRAKPAEIPAGEPGLWRADSGAVRGNGGRKYRKPNAGAAGIRRRRARPRSSSKSGRRRDPPSAGREQAPTMIDGRRAAFCRRRRCADR